MTNSECKEMASALDARPWGGATMKERPILFSGPMVQAILDGRKTQTRRIVKEPDWYACLTGDCPHYEQKRCAEFMAMHCPYGSPGDRLWVRETWAVWREGFDRRGHVVYRADMKDKAGEDFSRPDLMGLSKWYPSIHMKRVYSRLTLEITEIRVQRVQEISEKDAKAEGAMFHDGRGIGHSGWRHDFKDVHTDARSSFMSLWESINGPGSWAANRWVWCVSFKQVRP